MSQIHDEHFARVAQAAGILDADQITRCRTEVSAGRAISLADAALALELISAHEMAAIRTLARDLADNSGDPARDSRRRQASISGRLRAQGVVSGDLAEPTHLGDYDVFEQVGRGATGFVYRAVRRSDKLEVALKVLPLALVRDESEVHRFDREVETLRQLNHPNIIRVHDHGYSEGGYLYYAMDFLRGASLRTMINQRKRLQPYEAAEIVRDAAEGLAYAHDRGVIHRDVKPSNLVLTEKGKTIVVDFGIALRVTSASLTASGLALGTPAYMSPEQIEDRGHSVDHRTDVYSLGVTLYEALSGQKPFDGTTQYEMLRAIMFNRAVPLWQLQPQLPVLICDIVERAMQKRPDERYQSMTIMIDELDRFIDSTQQIN